MTLLRLSGSAIVLSLVLHFIGNPSDRIALAGDFNPAQHNFTATKILRHSRYPFYSVALTPDGQTLATAGYDDIIRSDREGTIKLWNLHTGQLLNTLTGHTDQIRAGADQKIRIWNLNTGELLRTLQGKSDIVKTVAFSTYRPSRLRE